MNKLFLIAVTAVVTGIFLSRYWQKKWFVINAPFGKKLGYPDCCIKEFCDQPPQLLPILGTNNNDRIRFEASHINGEYTGFIPCSHHAKKIIDGEITLSSLIQNRSAELPAFPNM